jgi:energy-coupling factor transporter transmembrane protein EcfT
MKFWKTKIVSVALLINFWIYILMWYKIILTILIVFCVWICNLINAFLFFSFLFLFFFFFHPNKNTWEKSWEHISVQRRWTKKLERKLSRMDGPFLWGVDHFFDKTTISQTRIINDAFPWEKSWEHISVQMRWTKKLERKVSRMDGPFLWGVDHFFDKTTISQTRIINDAFSNPF